MSTNYYFTPAPDSPLAIYGSIHIGKQSAGWVFSFRGYKHPRFVFVEVDRGLTMKVDTPALWITSWEDWLGELNHGTISNEYGSQMTLEEFYNSVVFGSTKLFNGKPLLCHAKEHADEYSWVDADGNSFSNYEFS